MADARRHTEPPGTRVVLATLQAAPKSGRTHPGQSPWASRVANLAGFMSPRAATFAVFMVNGGMIGTWVAFIPWKQAELGVSKGTIGLCLLCMAGGALVSMPLTGQILHRRSSAGVTRAATLVY